MSSCWPPVTVVTGAATGIGRAIALECAARGHRVVLAGLPGTELEEALALARAKQADAIAIPVDVTAAAQIEQLFEKTSEQFGGLDGVVANAGIAHAVKPFFEQSEETVSAMLSTNVMGTFLTVRGAAQRMIGQGKGGSIVITGSSTALRPVPGLLPYVLSKGAVHALAKAAAIELAPHRIRVNLLVPGTTATPLVMSIPGREQAAASETPMGEIVQPEELANAAAFLLGSEVPHMTGTQILIDSGRTI